MVKKFRNAKGVKLASVVLAVMFLTLTTAAAFSPPELSIQYYNNWETAEAQFRNELTSDAPASYLDSMQVNMTVTEYNSYISGTIIWDGFNSDTNPSDEWISVSCVIRGLPAGTYRNEGVGVIKYIDNIYNGERQYVTNSRVFAHNPNISTYSVNSSAQEIEEKSACYKMRGINQYALFGRIPDGYSCFLDSEMTNTVDTGIDFFDYLEIKQLLCLCYGDTIPTYFVSPDKNTVFVIKQDGNGNVFRFKFAKNNAGKFAIVELLDQVAEAEHVSNVTAACFSEHSVQAYTLDELPSDWEWYEDSNARAQFDSALSYLIVRDQIELTYGDTSIVYLFSADESKVVVLKTDICGAIHRYNFSKEACGTWKLNSHVVE